MKKKQMDVNNIRDNKRKKDHMYSDILGSNSGGKVSNNNGDSNKNKEVLHLASSDWT
jgi:hypothetical protein